MVGQLHHHAVPACLVCARSSFHVLPLQPISSLVTCQPLVSAQPSVLLLPTRHLQLPLHPDLLGSLHVSTISIMMMMARGSSHKGASGGCYVIFARIRTKECSFILCNSSTGEDPHQGVQSHDTCKQPYYSRLKRIPCSTSSHQHRTEGRTTLL